MAFLTVAGIDVSVAAASTPDVSVTEVGDRDRGFDGTQFGSVRTTKRTWSVTTIPMTPTNAATLRSALLATPTVTMTGTWVASASITVWPKLGKDTPIAKSGTFLVQMTFTLDEA